MPESWVEGKGFLEKRRRVHFFMRAVGGSTAFNLNAGDSSGIIKTQLSRVGRWVGGLWI
jgi:hypothetical protein